MLSQPIQVPGRQSNAGEPSGSGGKIMAPLGGFLIMAGIGLVR
jgi:hypothetical protein